MYTRELFELLCNRTGKNLGQLSLSLDMDQSTAANLLRTSQASYNLRSKLKEHYGNYPEVLRFLAQPKHYNTAAASAGHNQMTLRTLAKRGQVGPNYRTFETMDGLMNFVADGLGVTMLDVHMEVTIHLVGEPQDGIIQTVNTIAAGAEEFNAMQDYVVELQRVYTDWGHDYVTKYEVLDFTIA